MAMRKIKGHAMVGRSRIQLGWTGACQCGLVMVGETKAELSAAHLVHRREGRAAREALAATIASQRDTKTTKP